MPFKLDKIGKPIFCIPTTAGTGSEVTRMAVITDTETDEKMLLCGLALLPTAAIVDAELTLSLPKGLTAQTGNIILEFLYLVTQEWIAFVTHWKLSFLVNPHHIQTFWRVQLCKE